MPNTVDDIIFQCKQKCGNQNLREWSDYIKYIPDNGRGQITLVTAADCYLAAYGEMHKNKLQTLFGYFNYNNINNTFEIFDYGCGQGLATMVFIENAPQNILQRLKKVTLIDTGTFILNKAESYIRQIYRANMAGRIASLPICKISQGLPTLQHGGIDRIETSQPIVVHLFSNILDIAEINREKIAEIIKGTEGKHYILATHPGTDKVDPNGDRMDEFYGFFSKHTVSRNEGYFDNGKYWCHLFGSAEYQQTTMDDSCVWIDYSNRRATYWNAVENECHRCFVRSYVEGCRLNGSSVSVHQSNTKRVLNALPDEEYQEFLDDCNIENWELEAQVIINSRWLTNWINGAS